MVTAARTVSQIVLHMAVAFVTLYVVTGSIAFGGLAAILEPVCNVIVMPLHDKLWERIRERVDGTKRTRNAHPHRRPFPPESSLCIAGCSPAHVFSSFFSCLTFPATTATSTLSFHEFACVGSTSPQSAHRLPVPAP